VDVNVERAARGPQRHADIDLRLQLIKRVASAQEVDILGAISAGCASGFWTSDAKHAQNMGDRSIPHTTAHRLL
jgi:hypothetical protein